MDDSLGAAQERPFARASAATARAYRPERRLSAAQLDRYLSRRAYAVVSSARPDGRPHAAPSLVFRHGTEFWLPSVAGSVHERKRVLSCADAGVPLDWTGPGGGVTAAAASATVAR